MALTGTTLSRRTFALGAAALCANAPAWSRRRSGRFEVALLGQALIRHDLCDNPWPGFTQLSSVIRQSHACFSDLEVVIEGPRRGAPTRSDPETLHVAPPEVLDCLSRFGVSFLATSNNHAFDVGTGGILDTITALQARNLAFAGSGLDRKSAAAPGYQRTAAGTLAVVAGASGAVRDGGAATADRAGVNELRRGADGALLADDVDLMLEGIRAAAREADAVIAYQHNHYWEPENHRTPEWQRAFARRCIDAGASVFVGHGAPLLQGVEIYRGAPIFYGLGSFIFQTRKAEGAYGEPNWQSLIVQCRFDDGRFVDARLLPVQLAPVGVGGIADLATRGRPSLATESEARAILGRLESLSAALGHRLRHDGRTGLVSG